MKHLCVEFITPDVFFEVSNVSAIVSYTVDGEFVVLPGHERFIIELRSGLIKLKNDTGIVNMFYVLNPILKINSDNCKVIANQVINACDIDAVILKEYKEDIEKILHRIDDKMLLSMAKKAINFYK